MKNTPSKDMGTSASHGAATADPRKIILKEISAKWGKFSEQNLSDLKDKDDLVTQVAEKYQLEKNQAQLDVDTFLKGRQF